MNEQMPFHPRMRIRLLLALTAPLLFSAGCGSQAPASSVPKLTAAQKQKAVEDGTRNIQNNRAIPPEQKAKAIEQLKQTYQ